MFRFLRNLNPFALRRDLKALRATNLLLGKLAHECIAKMVEYKIEMAMSDDLLADAARTTQRYEVALIDAQTTISAVNTPNGTTLKLRRIVEEALAGREAKTLVELVG